MRRLSGPLFAKRFCGNIKSKEVHDLANEDESPSGCQIEKILKHHHEKTFEPDTLQQAHAEGYDNCAKCLTGSTR